MRVDFAAPGSYYSWTRVKNGCLVLGPHTEENLSDLGFLRLLPLDEGKGNAVRDIVHKATFNIEGAFEWQEVHGVPYLMLRGGSLRFPLGSSIDTKQFLVFLTLFLPQLPNQKTSLFSCPTLTLAVEPDGYLSLSSRNVQARARKPVPLGWSNIVFLSTAEAAVLFLNGERLLERMYGEVNPLPGPNDTCTIGPGLFGLSALVLAKSRDVLGEEVPEFRGVWESPIISFDRRRQLFFLSWEAELSSFDALKVVLSSADDPTFFRARSEEVAIEEPKGHKLLQYLPGRFFRIRVEMISPNASAVLKSLDVRFTDYPLIALDLKPPALSPGSSLEVQLTSSSIPEDEFTISLGSGPLLQVLREDQVVYERLYRSSLAFGFKGFTQIEAPSGQIRIRGRVFLPEDRPQLAVDAVGHLRLKLGGEEFVASFPAHEVAQPLRVSLTAPAGWHIFELLLTPEGKPSLYLGLWDAGKPFGPEDLASELPLIGSKEAVARGLPPSLLWEDVSLELAASERIERLLLEVRPGAPLPFISATAPGNSPHRLGVPLRILKTIALPKGELAGLVSDGAFTVVARMDGFLLGLKGGSPHWANLLPRITGSPVLHQDMLLVPSTRGLLVLHPGSGKVLWSIGQGKEALSVLPFQDDVFITWRDKTVTRHNLRGQLLREQHVSLNEHVDQPHGDSPHADAPHEDVPHGDSPPYSWTDVWEDGCTGWENWLDRVVIHQDVPHSDAAHADQPGANLPHADVVHADISVPPDAKLELRGRGFNHRVLLHGATGALLLEPSLDVLTSALGTREVTCAVLCESIGVPPLARSLAIGEAGGRVAILSLADGELMWSAELEGPVAWLLPTKDGLLVGHGKRVSLVDPQSGRSLLSCELPEALRPCSPVRDRDGFLAVLGTRSIMVLDNALNLLDMVQFEEEPQGFMLTKDGTVFLVSESSLFILVSDRCAPIVRIGEPPSDLEAGETIELRADVADVVPIQSITWYASTGTSGTGAILRVRPPRPGRYIVYCQVQNSLGGQSVARTLLQALPPSIPPLRHRYILARDMHSSTIAVMGGSTSIWPDLGLGELYRDARVQVHLNLQAPLHGRAAELIFKGEEREDAPVLLSKEFTIVDAGLGRAVLELFPEDLKGLPKGRLCWAIILREGQRAWTVARGTTEIREGVI